MQKQPFKFPDQAFPPLAVPVRGVPPSPLEKLAKIETGYHRLVRQVSGGRDLETNPSSASAYQSGSETTESSLAHRLSYNIYNSSASTGSNNDPVDLPSTKKLNVNVMFKWAREAVDFADSHFGMPPEILSAARDIIVLVAQSSPGLTRFKGAAQYILGVWYLFGLNGRNLDEKKAIEYFYAAAKSEYPRALYRIGTEFEKSGDTNNALQYFTKGTAANDSACLYRMAMCYLRGHLGVNIDVDKGKALLRQASDTSDPDSSQASYMFGLIQLGELPTVAAPYPNLPPSTGINAIERAAWVGFGPALLRMGLAWQGGEKGYDSTIALRYFHIVSRQQQYLRWKGDLSAGLGGHAEAEISKWMLCGSIDRFQANEEYAFYFAKLASEQENGLAEFAVGYFYEVGVYVDKDIQAALIWYGIAASHENKDAAARLKELSLSRENTITRQQHHRTLTINGRGSIRSSLKKKLEAKKAHSHDHNQQNQQHQEPKLESKYPDLTGTPGPDSRATSPSRRVISKIFTRKSDFMENSEPLHVEDQITDDFTYQKRIQQQQQEEIAKREQVNHQSMVNPPNLGLNSTPRKTRHSLPTSTHPHNNELSFSEYQKSSYPHLSNHNMQEVDDRPASPYVNGTPTIPLPNESFGSLQYQNHSGSVAGSRASSPLKKVPVGESRRRSSPMALGQSQNHYVNNNEYHNQRQDTSPYSARENIDTRRDDSFSASTAESFSKDDEVNRDGKYGENVDDIAKVLATIDLNQDLNQSSFVNGDKTKAKTQESANSKNGSQDDKKDGNKEEATPRSSWGAIGNFFGLNGSAHPLPKKPVTNTKDSENDDQKGSDKEDDKNKSTTEDRPNISKQSAQSDISSTSTQSNNYLSNSSISLPPPRAPAFSQKSYGYSNNSSGHSSPLSSGRGSPVHGPPMQQQHRRVTTPGLVQSLNSTSGASSSPHTSNHEFDSRENRRRAISNAPSTLPSTSDLSSSSVSTFSYPSKSVVNSSAASINTTNTSDSFASYATSNTTATTSTSNLSGRRPGKQHPRNPNVVVIDALPSQGRGPKTFEEMEVPVTKNKDDCLIM